MTEHAMQISDCGADRICNEQEIIDDLPLDRARILELGCGAAERTRLIAQTGRAASILAFEVDERQHAKNRTAVDLPSVRFELGGAEDIQAKDNSFDIVFLFKSLHHVPPEKMDQALSEIRRVLTPGGLAYISEPVFAGDYNEILRLFHDEKLVREAAFAAVERAIASLWMELVKQIFFKTPVRYRDFSGFEEKVLKVTHTEHRLSPGLYEEIRSRFTAHMKPEGAEFFTPIRVDLLRKPGSAAG